MPALAMTDHGNVFGAYDFWKKAQAHGVKPIIGTEAYVAPGSRFDKTRVKWGAGGEDDVSGGGAYTHMTMLATSTEGMHRLFKLSSLASLEGYYYKPRMDKELLAEHVRPNVDMIATTGCPSARSRPTCGWATTRPPSGRRGSSATSSARTTSTAS
jgi:DNA polymerase-3 subunit alpha